MVDKNTFRIQQNHRGNIFRWLETNLKLKSDWEEGLPMKYLPQLLFITLLCLLYIGNSHYAETSQRKMTRLKVQVEDLRADYTTLKADYMHARLQSEVAKRVKDMGLVESSDPPYKLIVNRD